MEVTFDNLALVGIAPTVPKGQLNFSQLNALFGEKEIQRISASTGIKSVRVAEKGMKTSDYCIAAAEKLIQELNVDRNTIDGVVLVSQTPDYRLPATACLLQDQLKLNKSIVAFDISYGCSGYMYGLFQAAALIKSGACQRILVCVGDTISRYLDPNDHKVRLVFGDGAAATLMEKGDASISFSLKTDGSGGDSLKIDKNEDNADEKLFMDGSAIMEFALREVPQVVDEVIEMQGWKKEDVSSLVLHQANAFMLNYLRKKIRIAKEKVPIIVDGFGNTGPASIPLALCESAATLNKDKVVMSGFGVGLSWGAAATSLKNTVLLPTSYV